MFKQKPKFFFIESTLPSYKGQTIDRRTQTQQECKHGTKSDQDQPINMQLYKRFENFLQNQKLFKLQKCFKKHCGRHYPINYKPQFGFQQYWEDTKSKFEQTNIIQYFEYPQLFYYFIALFILLSSISLTWTISVHRLFQMDNQYQEIIVCWGLITIIADIFFQYKVYQHYEYFKNKPLNKILESFWKHLLIFFYFALLPRHNKLYSHFWLLIDFSIAVLISIRVQEIWKSFRLQIHATQYKNSFKVAELFATLLPIAHTFALLLYFVAQLNTQVNWMQANDLQNLIPLDKYIYSLYFALTTMLTVGYGDISPVNIPQIIVIMIVQIIGIVTYGYIINQIGHIISQIRFQDQLLSKDIACISKMAKLYHTDHNLVQKAKNFLISRKRQHTHLTPEQENQTLAKLHDQLRQQIIQYNSLKILKSSLFYCSNWTKKFQLGIAKKLHKKIFTPNQEIFQIPGKERLYVFKKGKVEIHANRTSGYKKHFKKILRTIEPNETMEVSDNIYGYTFLLSNSPIKLTAINKDFVVAYFVEKKDFLETVMDSHLDQEYYFEMKTKIDSMSYPQSWEAPLIINTKEHYFPNIQYLIMKNKKAYIKQKNIRSSKFNENRYKNRSKRVFYRNFQEMEEQVCPVYEMVDPILNLANPLNEAKTEKVIPTNVTLQMISFQSDKLVSGVLQEGAVFKKQYLEHLFEQGKEYINFFKRFNCSQVLFKLQNSNFMLKSKKYLKSSLKTSGTSWKMKRSKPTDQFFMSS